MQTQVVHQNKAGIPWLPMLMAALVVAAILVAAQVVAFGADRSTTDGTTVPGLTSTRGEGGIGYLPSETAGTSWVSSVAVQPKINHRTKYGNVTESQTNQARDPALKAVIDRLRLDRTEMAP